MFLNGPASGRFKVAEQLGAGGFGIVYRAFDEVRGHDVALKTLRNVTADSLYRFKREFRSLVDIAHPNLVQLYDLFSDSDEWFFTMQLVSGRNFLDNAWTVTSLAADIATEPNPREDEIAARDSGAATTPAFSPANAQRLRDALRQLAVGVMALHSSGKLHRDIKPSNVLVRDDGTVTLLDFGLVSDLVPDAHASAHIVGTPAYMSPEQSSGERLSEATDWYSVGVMLYQALTGVLPYHGSYYHVVAEKQRSAPVIPAALVGGVPPDLNDVCVALLQPDPAARLTGDALLERLEVTRRPAPARRVNTRLIGRENEIAQLHEAYAASRGAAVVVCVDGTSGIGKSALVKHFIGTLPAAADAAVFTGRCYERESVPYKGLDAIIDDLAAYLSRRPAIEVEALMPRDAPALAKLFPVLRRIPNIVSDRRRHAHTPDAQEMRRRAFGALRELLTRLADQRPVVMFVDDVQWADGDSAALLQDLLHGADAPPLLVILTYRTDEAANSQFLRQLLDPAGGLTVRSIHLDELPPSDAAALTAELLGAEGQKSVQAIVTEAAGSPFFIEQLVRHFRGRGAAVDLTLSLGEMIDERIRELSATARTILTAVAVNGRPLRLKVARSAFDLDADADQAVAALRAERLVRTREGARDVEVEPYHDRVREVVFGRLSASDARQYHHRLAIALEQQAEQDPEVLAVHFAGAGDTQRAASYALLAAEKAHEALAFEHAARLYRLVLADATVADAERRRIQRRLGDALSSAGRGAEAAEAYMLSAAGAARGERIELQRRATEQLLLSGHYDQSAGLLNDLLSQIGMRLPGTAIGTLLSLLWLRLRLRLRGFRYKPRQERDVPPEELTRLDTCWSVSIGLALTDPIRAAVFQTRNLLMALRAGEPYRISRSLAMETGFQSVRGGRAARSVDSLAIQANAIAREVQHPHALALCTLFDAVLQWERGRWRDGLVIGERGEQMLLETCRGVAWELATARIFSMASRIWLGEWKDHWQRLSALVKEAETRGDLYAAVTLPLLCYSYCHFLADDDPDGAHAYLQRSLSRWSIQSFDLQHYWALYGDCEADLYAGEATRARERLEESSSSVKRSLLLQVQAIDIFHQYLAGRVALAETGRRDEGTRKALKHARKLEREKMPWANAFALCLRSAVAARAGDEARALDLIGEAARAFAVTEMRMFEAAARIRQGRLMRGDGGATIVAQACESMRAQRVKAPERLASMLVPS